MGRRSRLGGVPWWQAATTAIMGAWVLCCTTPASGSALRFRRNAHSDDGTNVELQLQAELAETQQARAPAPTQSPAPEAANAGPQRLEIPSDTKCETACLVARTAQAQSSLTLEQFNLCVACHTKMLRDDLNKSLVEASVANEKALVTEWSTRLAMEANLLTSEINKQANVAYTQEEASWKELFDYKIKLIDAVRHGVILAGYDAVRLTTDKEVKKRAADVAAALSGIRDGPIADSAKAWATARNVSQKGADAELNDWKFAKQYLTGIWDQLAASFEQANAGGVATQTAVNDASWNRGVAILAADMSEETRQHAENAVQHVERAEAESQVVQKQTQSNSKNLKTVKGLVDDFVNAHIVTA